MVRTEHLPSLTTPPTRQTRPNVTHPDPATCSQDIGVSAPHQNSGAGVPRDRAPGAFIRLDVRGMLHGRRHGADEVSWRQADARRRAHAANLRKFLCRVSANQERQRDRDKDRDRALIPLTPSVFSFPLPPTLQRHRRLTLREARATLCCFTAWRGRTNGRNLETNAVR